MFQGFYNLTSGMLTHNRNLNVVSNNLTNVLTPGYKKETMVSSTFQEEMMARTGNIDKSSPEELNEMAMFRSPIETITDYSQGSLEETDNPLDFALLTDGFFRIQTQNGFVYSRNGSFSIDNEGYLSLPDGGRVMGKNGPILLGTDDFYADKTGNVFGSNGQIIDQFDIVDFEDKTQLNKIGNSIFATNAQPIPVAEPSIEQKILERSNVDTTLEFASMLETQRALQGAAQVLKIYDQLMASATTEIGRI